MEQFYRRAFAQLQLVASLADLARKRAMGGIKASEVRNGARRGQFVYGHQLQLVGQLPLVQGARHAAPNPTIAVNRKSGGQG
jgi:hypothetical protein